MVDYCNRRGGCINNSTCTIIELSPDIVQKCIDFANNRISLSEDLYRSRGEDRLEKMKNDIIGTI
jgi:hypothetical protein